MVNEPGHTDGRQSGRPVDPLVEDLVRRYRQTGQLTKWPLPLGIEEKVQITCRGIQAQKASQLSVDEMVGNYLGFSIQDFAQLYETCRFHLVKGGTRWDRR